MFRDYLRRLESDKVCQSLNIQSFLLLPMQRITRLPLLILAILNRTPLDHPDHDLVERTLRAVQKVRAGGVSVKCSESVELLNGGGGGITLLHSF